MTRPQWIGCASFRRRSTGQLAKARIPEPSRRDEARTETLAGLSRFYDEARSFSRMMTEKSMQTYGREFVVATGGGRGVIDGNRAGDGVGEVHAAAHGEIDVPRPRGG